MPFKSEAQRRLLWAKHPDIAREFADATPKGTKLPAHVKKSHLRGTADALESFGFKAAAEEIRLKMTPGRQFHGIDKALKDKTKKADCGHDPLEPQASPDQPVEILTQMLQQLETPTNVSDQASRDKLDRQTAWGPPSHLGAGDSANRGSDMGQNTSFGGV